MFSIIIPTFNNIKYLQLCLKSIKKNSSYNHEIIIHVNIGNDGTLEYLEKIILSILTHLIMQEYLKELIKQPVKRQQIL